MLRFKALSSSEQDLHKNMAMAWMRLQGLVGVALQFKDSILKLVDSQPEFGENLLDPSIVNTLLTKQSHVAVMRHAKMVMAGFVEANPHDKDVMAFQAGIKQIEEAESSQGSGAQQPRSGKNTTPTTASASVTQTKKRKKRASAST